jgi:hypothetical protein
MSSWSAYWPRRARPTRRDAVPAAREPQRLYQRAPAQRRERWRSLPVDRAVTLSLHCATVVALRRPAGQPYKIMRRSGDRRELKIRVSLV